MLFLPLQMTIQRRSSPRLMRLNRILFTSHVAIGSKGEHM